MRSDTKAIIDHIKSCEECVFNCDHPQFIFEHTGKDAKESAIALNEKRSSEEDDEKAQKKVQAKNNLENYIYNVRSTVVNDEKMKTKFVRKYMITKMSALSFSVNCLA